ncbi:hypothetical protein ACP8Y2_16000 [Herpetosiphon llansteffanensis]
MQPKYQVPANRSPYRWRMIIRLIIAVFGGFFPMIFTIGYQLYFYQRYRAAGGTVDRYITIEPWLWSMLPLSFALGCLLIGISRDGWLLVKRQGTSTVVPILYWLSLLFVVLSFVLYILNVRIP